MKIQLSDENLSLKKVKDPGLNPNIFLYLSEIQTDTPELDGLQI